MGIQGNKITIVDSEFYAAWCYPDAGLIHHQWQKHCSGNDFRDSLTAAVSAFEKFNCFKWLSDDSKFNGTIQPDDWKWGEIHFTNRIIEVGWKYSAMVMPAKTLARISETALCNYLASRGVDTKFFTEIDKAIEWIGSK